MSGENTTHIRVHKKVHSLVKSILENAKREGLDRFNEKLPEGIELESFNQSEVVEIGLRMMLEEVEEDADS